MKRFRTMSWLGVILIAAASTGVAAQQSSPQTGSRQYEPKVGQPGKDTPWVPTPEEMVERMLDLANVTDRDIVVDLGSGDGRNVIGAAKRGARARGVEYNPDLVEYARRRAAEAGVSGKATFVQGDMYKADVSDATVLVLFLLPENLRKLMPTFTSLKPGTRIVANTFGLPGWTPVRTARAGEGCRAWCEAMLYVVPAEVAGTWTLGSNTLEISQTYQTLTGTFTVNGEAMPLENAAIHGTEITFTANGVVYAGTVNGTTIEGTAGGQRFRATRK